MQNLTDFIFREAGSRDGDRLSLLRYLVPKIRIQRGHDFNELYELDHNARMVDLAKEDIIVAPCVPGEEMAQLPPADSEMLLCITARPFSKDGYTDSPYTFVRDFALSLRAWMMRPAAGVDFEGSISHAYIQDEHLSEWNACVSAWRERTTKDTTQMLSAGTQKTHLAASLEIAPSMTTQGNRHQATQPPIVPLQEIAKSVATEQAETKEQRQDNRLKACEAAGLNFSTYKGRLPDGVGKVASSKSVKRQPFSVDVKAALVRRQDAKRVGITTHRA